VGNTGEGYPQVSYLAKEGGIRKSMEKTVHIVGKISKLLDRFAQFALIILMLLVVVNIVLRVVFGSPILGTYEITGFLFAIVISLAIGYCSFQDGHIKVDFLAERFPLKVQIVAEIILKLVAFGFFVIATWTLWNYGFYLKAVGEVSPSAKIHFYYFVFVIAAGFAIFCIDLLIKLIMSIKDVPKKWSKGYW
jgi:TRAP-type C4-dicarboxylate transport system permease small subunit